MPISISLFTGAGGLDLGLHTAGFRAAVAVEFDPTAVETLKHRRNVRWWRDCAILAEPVEGVTSKRMLKQAGLVSGQVDLLVGGPPCQPFSKSGYWHSGDAKRLADPRAKTLKEYLRVLEETLPRAFLLENVPGLAFSDKDEGLNYLRESLEEVNRRTGTRYTVNAAQLNAVEYGVPQVRERVVVVGARDGRSFLFPRPTHRKPPSVDMTGGGSALSLPLENGDGLKRWTSAWDALGHLIDNRDPDLAPRGKWAALLPSIPEGHNYLYHTSRGGGAAIFGWRTRYWSMLLKLAKDRPSWTLTAQPGPAIGPFHWENRRLSAEELAALQTFPSKYHIVGNASAAQKQLGNAVPSALAEILGHEIRKQLLGESYGRRRITLVPALRSDVPAPAPISPIPVQYLKLVGQHPDHPGEGRGPGAARRTAKAHRLAAE